MSQEEPLHDIRDTNVELIGSGIDHRVKYNSAATEPAWNDGKVGQAAGLNIWRIESFEVVPWPREKYGLFYDGDSFIILHSQKVGNKDGTEKLVHDIFFWLGSKTSQDEAGTAAYKTVELDEFLHGAAIQHREVQENLSDEFLELFPRLSIRSGGVESGFRHVEEEQPEEYLTLLRVFKNPHSATGVAAANGVVVHEVEPTWRSLDENDVFILDTGIKIWVWQGKNCSPMEKAKAAQVVHDLTQAKHVDVEVLSQTESRSRVVVDALGGKDDAPREGFKKARPLSKAVSKSAAEGSRKLFRLSDASGQLSFSLVNDKAPSQSDLDGNDVFLLDDAGRVVWVWEGHGASKAEKARWLQVAQSYLRQLEGNASRTPIVKVSEGNESTAFLKAIQAY